MGLQIHGAFQWNELRVRDVEKAKEFYANTLGWTYEMMPMNEGQETYYLCQSGGQMVAGMFEMSEATGFPADVPPHWLGYIQVDDVDQRLATAQKLGAEVLFGPEDVPGVGRFAVMMDGAGAPIGIITPDNP